MEETRSGYSIFSLEEDFNSFLLIIKKRTTLVKKQIIIIAALFLFGGNLLFAQAQKIGYVDSQIILTQYAPAIKAQGDLDALTNLWSSKVDSMTLAYQQQLNEYQKQANNMPQDKQLQAQQKLIKMEQDILDFRRQKFAQPDGEIFKKQEQIFAPIKDKIYAAIKKVADQEGMKFIFDKSGDIILLYADPAFDITYKVLDALKTGK